MEGWTTFNLSKTSEKGLYPSQGEQMAHELDKSGIFKALSPTFLRDILILVARVARGLLSLHTLYTSHSLK